MLGKTHYLYAKIQNGISRKGTRSSYNERMKKGTSSSSSDYETTPKDKKSFGKNFNAKFDARMKMGCEFILKANNELFQNRTRKPKFVLCSFQHFLNSKLCLSNFEFRKC